MAVVWQSQVGVIDTAFEDPKPYAPPEYRPWNAMPDDEVVVTVGPILIFAHVNILFPFGMVNVEVGGPQA